jgi:hypothetical protein
MSPEPGQLKRHFWQAEPMRVIAAFAALSLLALSGCGGEARYAGLSRKQAVGTAKTVIQLRLDPSKRPYFDTSIWNIAAHHATDSEGRPAWFVGIWNGQAQTGKCALAAARKNSMVATVVSCADYPRFGQ